MRPIFLRFGIFPPQICDSYGATQRRNYETFDGFLTDLETMSKSIHIADAIRPQNATKLTKKCGSEFGGLMWRHLTPQRKIAIGCTTTVPYVHNSPKDILENLIPV